MMRNKRFLTITACVLAAAFLLGLTDTVKLAEASAEPAGEDRLIGVLVTKEHLDLFDFEAYFNDHTGELLNGGGSISESDASKYQNRLYATVACEELTAEDGEIRTLANYSFSDVDGISYFSAVDEGEFGKCYGNSGDEAISDGNMSVAVLDSGRDVTLKGTIYTVIGNAMSTLYFNPVYQAADGSVYTTAGSGFSSSGDIWEGETYTQTLSAEYRETKNGVTTVDSTSVTVSIHRVYRPLSVRVVQMDENNALLSTREYAPGKLPEKIVLMPGTAYVVVESTRQAPAGENSVSRTFFDRGAKTIDALYDRGDGICIKQFAALEWGA